LTWTRKDSTKSADGAFGASRIVLSSVSYGDAPDPVGTVLRRRPGSSDRPRNADSVMLSSYGAANSGAPATARRFDMKSEVRHTRSRALALAFTVLAPVAFSVSVWANTPLALTGAEEVPPVTTSAKGTGTITVGSDRSLSGSITTTGIDATAAHIHQGAAGKNGGVVIPLVKSGDTFSVPPNTKFTEAQYKAFQAGEMYVNVHSAAHKDGEIRAQLKP
jgi:hypothetical protein